MADINMTCNDDARLFPALTGECSATLELLLDSINAALKTPARFANRLPWDIENLSRLLTSSRDELRRELRGGYLGSPANINAYCRYFLPWNVWRICRLFSSPSISRVFEEILMSKEPPPDAISVLDLGSGPLTLPIALWAAFPALRELPLSVAALDHNKKALNCGLDIFNAFTSAAARQAAARQAAARQAAARQAAARQTATQGQWQIKTRVTRIEEKNSIPKAQIVCAVNVLNELTEHTLQADIAGLRAAAERYAALFIRRIAEGGAALIAEPGTPRSAQFLLMIKTAFEKRGFYAAAPCPHNAVCAMAGGRRGSKWCHWTLDAKDAPRKLVDISQKAHLAKEKATLSFLLLREKPKPEPAARQALGIEDEITVRVISESFKLEDGGFGRYGCSSEGLILLVHKQARALYSGDAVVLPRLKNRRTDAKSGALIIAL